MIRGEQHMWRFPKCFFFLVSIFLLISLPLLASGNRREVMTEPTTGDVRVVLRYSVGPGNVDEIRELLQQEVVDHEAEFSRPQLPLLPFHVAAVLDRRHDRRVR